MNLNNHKGFSLVSVLVTISLLGAVSLGVMHLIKNIQQGQNFAKNVADEMELRTEIRMLLDNEKFCRVSLAGDGPQGTPSNPVQFNKVDIDEDSEGMDVELWLSNQKGDARTTKKFSTSDSAKNKYGQLKILSMKLLMNNESGINYSESSGHEDVGELRIQILKQVSETQTRTIPLTFPVVVGMSTDTNGKSTILSCSRVGAAKQSKIASGQNVVGPNPSLNSSIINLEDYGFNPTGNDPHIIVSERDYNFASADGNTMDASYCGFTKSSKLVFVVVCWASPNNSDGTVQSSFDWIAIQN